MVGVLTQSTVYLFFSLKQIQRQVCHSRSLIPKPSKIHALTIENSKINFYDSMPQWSRMGFFGQNLF